MMQDAEIVDVPAGISAVSADLICIRPSFDALVHYGEGKGQLHKRYHCCWQPLDGREILATPQMQLAGRSCEGFPFRNYS